MTHGRRDEVPIGLLLRRADEAISDQFAQALEDQRIGRIHWQLLNAADSTDQSFEEIIAKLPRD